MGNGYTLDKRYSETTEPVLITGVQALARMMLLQAKADRLAGLNTAGFVSGYRGSPLGTVDSTFARIKAQTDEAGIVVRPGVNEELAATAVAGTQQVEGKPQAKVQGVYALWYGKGPGLDRASDAVRHGNYQGSSAHGGVVLCVGDDHTAKSSSINCYTDPVVAALHVPIFYPADADDVVLFGLHGFAMSRLTGSWAALKIVPEIADSTYTHIAPALPLLIKKPIFDVPLGGLHNRWPDTPMDQEARQIDYRLPAVYAYLAANPLDRIVGDRSRAKIGIMAAGKSWNDLREALRLLGVDDDALGTLGIALFKPAVIWPIQQAAIDFSTGLDQLIVVEEKGGFFEDQLRAALYGQPKAPTILGKRQADGKALFSATGGLTPEAVAKGLAAVLSDILDPKQFADLVPALSASAAAAPLRKPFFCSGCPHNRSTAVPEGSRALAGIGCHGLAAYNNPNTSSFAQMGGEGMHWVGMAPFTDEKHIFANQGDGTYFHSGFLAIRQAVAAKVNITYKLLYNSAVAMTGGQQIDGELTLERLAAQLRAEGVDRVVLVSEDPDRDEVAPTRALVHQVAHRDDLEAVQIDLRERPGVSVIIYEQYCATERRRLRKRGQIAEPTSRAFINELVCEGCGDCSVKSNCLSVEPVQTSFGTKRRINQSTCNKDFSCIDGFCPSFVQIEGAKIRKQALAPGQALTLPEPDRKTAQHERIVVAGVGGTGVVTIGALLSTAVHISGDKAAVLDQVGMAQKGGAVASHIHIARGEEPIHALRVPARQADVVIACDTVVANLPDLAGTIAPGRTWVLINTDTPVTGDFTRSRDAVPDSFSLSKRLGDVAGDEHTISYPFGRISEALLGDTIGSNLMMVGYAWQRGWLGVDAVRLDEAIVLNGQAIELNRAAFALGRQLAVDPDAVLVRANLKAPEEESFPQLVQRLSAFLTGYQDAAYAQRFETRVAAIAAAEQRVADGTVLATTAARSLFKLMAYKDEYEVARLYSGPEFRAAVERQFDGAKGMSYFMAPPIFARKDSATGLPRKRRFGPWMGTALRVLAGMKGLRGTAFDPLGYTAERKMERALIPEFEALLDGALSHLTPENHQAAVQLAAMPMEIRGYGHIKEKAVEQYRKNVLEWQNNR